jgi:hypothetical protein
MDRLQETDEATEPSEPEWLRAATANPAFKDLADPAEDTYTLEDGKPFVVPS